MIAPQSFRATLALLRNADLTGRPIRVAYCIDNLGVGGTELNAVRTAERLDKAKFELFLICLQPDGPLRQRYEAVGIPVIPFRLSGLASFRFLTEGIRLARFLRSSRIDVVHSHDMYNNFFATLWARLAGVPLVIASRRWWHTLPGRRHHLTNSLGFRLAHRVLANSPAVAESVKLSERVPPRKILVVPNFVDDDAFAPLRDDLKDRMLSEIGVPPGALVLGSVARLSSIKNHSLLLQAFRVLAPRWPSLHLVFVGDGPDRAVLEESSRQLGIASRVHFAGARPNNPNLHGLLDISLLASTSEGFPNTIVEAMAAGRPVIATRVGGTADAVVHGETGLLVSSPTPELFVEAIESLLTAPEVRRKLGDAGRRRAGELYHASRVIPYLEHLYGSERRTLQSTPVGGCADYSRLVSVCEAQQ